MFIVFKDGQVLLGDDGNPKITATDPAGGDCCCVAASPCGNCDAGTPAQWRVEFSGVVEGTCGSCNDFNTTSYILSQTADPCVWRVNISTCWGVTAATNGYIEIIMFSTGMQLQVVYEFSGIPAPVRFTDSSTDCEAVHTPTYRFQSGSVNCVFGGATVTATPL